MLILQHSVD